MARTKETKMSPEQQEKMTQEMMASLQSSTYGKDYAQEHSSPDFDYASPILDFSIFRGQNRHFCPRLVSFEHQTRA